MKNLRQVCLLLRSSEVSEKNKAELKNNKQEYNLSSKWNDLDVEEEEILVDPSPELTTFPGFRDLTGSKIYL